MKTVTSYDMNMEMIYARLVTWVHIILKPRKLFIHQDRTQRLMSNVLSVTVKENTLHMEVYQLGSIIHSGYMTRIGHTTTRGQ
jgi:hypothetical protein